MLRLASSRLVPSSSSAVVSNALRAILSPPNIYGSIPSAAQNSPFNTPNPYSNFSHNFSTDAKTKKSTDRLLAKALKSEIKTKHSSLNQTMPEPPADFPFTIEDNLHESSLTLRRAVPGEDIFVSVRMPSFIPKNDDDDDDDSYKCMCCGGPVETDLYVSVTKKNRKILDFGVSVSADEMHVRTMSIIEPESEHQTDQFPMLCFCPHYNVSDVDSELQSALGEYLESRGIRKSDALFLYKYMVKKSKRQHLAALEKHKTFVQEKENGSD